MTRVILKIGGMSCPACSGGLEKALNRHKGVVARVNLMMNNALIDYDEKQFSLQDIEKFIAAAGFESLGQDNYQQEVHNRALQKPKLIVLGICAVLLMFFSLSSQYETQPTFKQTHSILFILDCCILCAASIWCAADILRAGIYSIKNRTPDMTTLVLLGVTTSTAYSLFNSLAYFWGANTNLDGLFFESPAMVLFFVKLGNLIENKGKVETLKAIQGLMNLTPEKASVLENDTPIERPIDEINVGDTIFCRPGERIAADGIVTNGQSHNDESFITGESMPIKKTIGSKVTAGAINIDSTICYKVEKIGRNSKVSSIVRLTANAAANKPKIQRLADKFGGIFVYATIAIAILAFLSHIIINHNLTIAINSFVSVLAAACPCAIGLAAPMAIMAVSANLANHGIMLKNSAAIEPLCSAKKIVFDKTGTLTIGKPQVENVIYFGLNQHKTIEILAAIEQNSNHPLAKAIVEFAKNQNILPQKTANFENHNGLGVSATIDNHQYFAGNLVYMHQLNINTQPATQNATEFSKNGCSLVYFADETQLIALVSISDTIRTNASQTIAKLKSLNIQPSILTGDNIEATNYIAQKLAIENFTAQTMPEKKADYIINLKKNNDKVIMVGDGINDCPAMICADVSIAISTGTDIAADSSDILLSNTNLDNIVYSIKQSKKAIKNIRQNLIWAIIYNSIMIFFATGFIQLTWLKATPATAAAAMALSSLTVVINALRVKEKKN